MSNLKTFTQTEIAPLGSLDEWEEDVLKRYPEQEEPTKEKSAFRNYDAPVRDTVRRLATTAATVTAGSRQRPS